MSTGGTCFFFFICILRWPFARRRRWLWVRGCSFGSDLWCHVKINGSRRLLGFGFLDSALASLRVSRHSPPLLHRGLLAAPRLLSSTGLFLFCVGLQAMSRSGPNLHSRIRFNPAWGADKRGDFTTNLATALCHCLLPVAHPRPRCSTKTSLGLRTPPVSGNVGSHAENLLVR